MVDDSFAIKLIRSQRRTLGLEINDDTGLLVRAPYCMRERDIHKFIQEKRFWILKQQAKLRECRQVFLPIIPISKVVALHKIRQRVKHYAGLLGIKYGKVRITRSRKRWGSCGKKSNLNFSIGLASVPPEVIDYVVVHELTHILVKDHSAKFWAQVATFFPDYKTCRKWLRENGHILGS